MHVGPPGINNHSLAPILFGHREEANLAGPFRFYKLNNISLHELTQQTCIGFVTKTDARV